MNFIEIIKMIIEGFMTRKEDLEINWETYYKYNI